MASVPLILASRPSTTVHRGREIARGGEGAIYELTSYSESVVKLYHCPLSPQRAAKLRAMIGLTKDRIPPGAAWPSDLIIGRGDAVLGLVMPRITGGHDLHTLLSGAPRRTRFPTADYRMLVATAANLARAVAAVHMADHVVGDLNERCAMVGSDATVRLIDCDSWQIEVGSTLYTCDVGIPMYQPPEMQQVATLRGRKRTRNHDAFGLAVLIFQLLFFGRHPFAGRPAKGEAPELSEAIRTLKFAWEGTRGLERPPDTLGLSDVGPKIASYFQRAFSRDGVDKGRPRAGAWATALDEMQSGLNRCRSNTAHWHLDSQCPICELERKTGVVFFIGRLTEPAIVYNPEREANAFWAAIQAEVPPPARGSAPTPGSFQASITPIPYPKPHRSRWIGRLLQTIGLLEPGSRAERVRREAELIVARRRYEDLVKAWQAHDQLGVFNRRLSTLKIARDRLTALFEQRHQAITAAQRWQGLQRFLSAYGVAEAKIKGFGRSLLGTLIAYGIGTAADVSTTSLSVIPGIGSKRRAALVAWRDELARLYRPARSGVTLDANTIKQIDARHHSEITQLLETLRGGASSLRTLADRERKKMATERGELIAAARSVAQADADLNAPTAD